MVRVAEAPPEYGEGEKSEKEVLLEYLNTDNRRAELSRKLKAAEDNLSELLLARYSKLNEEEIKTLVIEDKWLGTLAAAVQSELDRLSQRLTGRIRQLAERYATPLPKVTAEVAELETKVAGHLKRMGAVWK